MKMLFWLLLLVNIVLFVLIKWGWFWLPETTVHVQPDINGEKVRVLRTPQTATEVNNPSLKSSQVTTPAPVLAPTTTLVPTPKSVTQLENVSEVSVTANRDNANMHLSLSMSSPTEAGTMDLTCLEWGDFSGEEMKRARAALDDLKLGSHIKYRQVDQVARYWVFIPPLKNKASINEKIAQLKARGIQEYYVVQQPDPWKNAVSLGVFKTREAAQNFLNMLQTTKDINTAKVGERIDRQKATYFILNDMGNDVMEKFVALQNDFPGNVLKYLDCKH